MIKNLVFDFGKVLVDYDIESFFRSLFEREEDLLHFAAVTEKEHFVNRMDKGEQNMLELTREMQGKYPQFAWQLQQFHDRNMEIIIGEIPGMRALIEEYRAKGYGIYGLTNWSEAVYQVRDRYDILQMMDGTLISSEEKLIKPDPAIFRRFCEKFSLKAHECLFTDDRPENIEGARSVGMTAILFLNPSQFSSELKKALGE